MTNPAAHLTTRAAVFTDFEHRIALAAIESRDLFPADADTSFSIFTTYDEQEFQIRTTFSIRNDKDRAKFPAVVAWLDTDPRTVCGGQYYNLDWTEHRHGILCNYSVRVWLTGSEKGLLRDMGLLKTEGYGGSYETITCHV